MTSDMLLRNSCNYELPRPAANSPCNEDVCVYPGSSFGMHVLRQREAAMIGGPLSKERQKTSLLVLHEAEKLDLQVHIEKLISVSF